MEEFYESDRQTFNIIIYIEQSKPGRQFFRDIKFIFLEREKFLFIDTIFGKIKLLASYRMSKNRKRQFTVITKQICFVTIAYVVLLLQTMHWIIMSRFKSNVNWNFLFSISKRIIIEEQLRKEKKSKLHW